MEIKKIGNGILLKYNGKKYAIDKVPKNIGADIHLISHAHSDHLPPGRRLKVIASEETVSVAKLRGYNYHKIEIDNYRDIEIIESGHILGSWSFLIDGKILYTGDINMNNRLFLKGFQPQQADILIIEATYGDPRYTFGTFKKLLDSLIRRVSKDILSGNNIIIQAHPLGKLQLITKVFEWYRNTYVTNSVYKYNKLCNEFGYLENPGKLFEEVPDEPFILIGGRQGKYMNILTEKYNPTILTLSGWMVRHLDKGLPISDHCDFYDLLRVVDKVSPKKIYTIFGFKEKLAKHLNDSGYEATSL